MTGKLKILLIEDDLDLIRGWQDLFELLGHDLTCHSRGLLALADHSSILNSNLVISDYYLPDINGVELLRRIRQLNESLPAILLTGSRDPGIVEAVRTISRCTLLNKPVNIEDIEAQIASLPAA